MDMDDQEPASQINKDYHKSPPEPSRASASTDPDGNSSCATSGFVLRRARFANMNKRPVTAIGEAALKEFVSQVKQPRCYLIGRSEEAATRIIDECKTLNADAHVMFMRTDASLVKEVDRLCEDIKSKEDAINVLFLSAGAAVFDRQSMFVYQQ